MSSEEGGRPGHDKQIVVPEHKVAAAQALEVVNRALEQDPEAFKASPRDAFERARESATEASLKLASYDDIPAPVRTKLEDLSPEELRLLAELNEIYVSEGLYVEVPSPGRLFYH